MAKEGIMARIARAFRAKPKQEEESKTEATKSVESALPKDREALDKMRPKQNIESEKKPESVSRADPNGTDVESALKRLEDSGQISAEQRKKMREMMK